MFETIHSILQAIGQRVAHEVPVIATVAVVFTVIAFIAHRDKPHRGRWWRKPELATDLVYALIMPIIGTYMRVAFLSAGVFLIASMAGMAKVPSVDTYLDTGIGFLSALPFWAQVIVYMVVADVMLYWTHRTFHGAGLWRYHAIHHAPEDLDWSSAYRFHPINVVMHSVLVDSLLLLAGISPQVLIFLVPFNVFMSAFVHADLDWDLGPFRMVLASPVFHRWHHTSPEEGGEMNFAPTFPIIDKIFGTYYMPEDKLPVEFGVDDRAFPKRFDQQMLYPFRKPDAEPEPTKLTPAE
jgi:sterol desaturase/sphingolipid hydroxylase (fatty acid hydroxylase superfamily)